MPSRPLDPSRTTMLRRQFITEMQRRFGAIRRAIIQAVDKDDVFALRGQQGVSVLNISPGKRAFQFRTDAGKIHVLQSRMRRFSTVDRIRYGHFTDLQDLQEA